MIVYIKINDYSSKAEELRGETKNEFREVKEQYGES